MKISNLQKNIFTLAATASMALGFGSSAFATMTNSGFVNNMSQKLSTYTLDCGHWYVGANLGMSHLHDNKNAGTTHSVDENGPGGSVLAGYQFNSILGTELGYTQYTNSREMAGSAIFARTQHYAVDLAATARYPVFYQWSLLGKLGAAYSYAQKMVTATGGAKSSGAGSVYWGLGVDYSLTRTVDIVAQFAEAAGNNYTGSADLWSVGFNFAIV